MTKYTLKTLTALAVCTALTSIASPVFAQNVGQGLITQPATPLAAAPQTETNVIRSIDVTGLQRIEADTVRSYIQLRPGQAYTKASLDQALRDLYSTEIFADVVIKDNQGALTIQITENPVVNRVLFEGNKRLKEDKLNPEVKLAPRDIFTRSKIRADVGRILELYRRQGRYGATVEPKMVKLDQNRVDVVYEINEGPKSKVRQIYIIGNHAYKQSVLTAQMATKVSSLKHLMSSSTSYDADRLAYDQSKLRQFYLTQGYADFRIISAVAELTPNKKDFNITYVVEEGKRYKLGNVSVESDIHDLKPEIFKPLVPMEKGDWYNAKAVEDTVDNLNKQAGLFGYAFADAEPQFVRHPEQQTMDLIFKMKDAARVYVERIDINGNTVTQDKVIRREFRLGEGDTFNSFQIKRSSDRIQSLGYFQDKLEIEQKPGSAPDKVILTANLEEKSTGELQFSAGYSSLEKLVFSASVRQRNFRGAGQELRLQGSISTYGRSIDLGFTDPYAFNKNIAIGGDIFRRSSNSFNYIGTSRNTTYNQTTTGFQVRAGIPLNEYWSLALRYGWSSEQVDLDQSYYIGNTCSVLLAGRYLCDAVGNRSRSTLGYSLVHDTLDNRQRPHNGTRFIFSQDLTGPGGSVQNLRTAVNFAKYKDLGKGWILSGSAEGGAVIPLKSNATSDPVLLTDRFFLGEPQMAGFDIRGVGPRVLRNYVGQSSTIAFAGAGLPATGVIPGDAYLPKQGYLAYDPSTYTSTTYDAIGGRFYYKARLELEIPLGSGAKELGLRPSIFADVGAVWGVRKPTLIQATDPYFTYTDSDGSTKTYTYNAPLGKTNAGNQIYQVPTNVSILYNGSSVSGATTICASGYTPNPTSATDPNCTGSLTTGVVGANSTTRQIAPFSETFTGNTPRPRLSIGFGVNWNSPFGPFRIDIAKALLKSDGDQTKLFTFNVGTQF